MKFDNCLLTPFLNISISGRWIIYLLHCVNFSFKHSILSHDSTVKVKVFPVSVIIEISIRGPIVHTYTIIQ